MNANKLCECSKVELDLFSVPPLNTSMERSNQCIYHPISSLSDSGPIEFNVSGSSDEYIDLGRTMLYIKLQVTKKNGESLEDTAKVAPVNLLLHSLFSQIDIKLRDTLITPSVHTYPYKAYLETLLSYGTDAKESQLSSELWNADVGGFNVLDPYGDTNNNTGMKNRASYIAKSKTLELMGRPHCDIFLQDRYLINGVDMYVKLIRSNEMFHLMSADENVVTKILDAHLHVRKVKIHPTIALQHGKLLDQGTTIKYPIRRSIVSSFTIPTGNLSFNKENVVSGQIPRRIVIGFVNNAAFNGSFKINPFNFQHYHLDYLSLNTGSQNFPSQALKPDFENEDYMRSYMTLFEGTGMLNTDRGHGVTRQQFLCGYTLYAFDLTPDMCEGSHLDPIKYGNLRMEVHFKKALPHTINAVIFSEYDNLIQIDRARNVITDFTSS